MIFNAGPLLDICTVIEEWGYWVTVRQKRAPHLLVEWSSNDWHVFKQHNAEERYYIHREVPITYLGMHSRNRTVAEFQLGVWGIAPEEGSEAYALLGNILVRMKGFRPNNVAAPNHNETWFYQRLTEPQEDASGGGSAANSGHEDANARRYLSVDGRAMRRRLRGQRGALGRGGYRSVPVSLR